MSVASMFGQQSKRWSNQAGFLHVACICDETVFWSFSLFFFSSVPTVLKIASTFSQSNMRMFFMRCVGVCSLTPRLLSCLSSIQATKQLHLLHADSFWCVTARLLLLCLLLILSVTNVVAASGKQHQWRLSHCCNHCVDIFWCWCLRSENQMRIGPLLFFVPSLLHFLLPIKNEWKWFWILWQEAMKNLKAPAWIFFQLSLTQLPFEQSLKVVLRETASFLEASTWLLATRAVASHKKQLNFNHLPSSLLFPQHPVSLQSCFVPTFEGEKTWFWWRAHLRTKVLRWLPSLGS